MINLDTKTSELLLENFRDKYVLFPAEYRVVLDELMEQLQSAQCDEILLLRIQEFLRKKCRKSRKRKKRELFQEQKEQEKNKQNDFANLLQTITVVLIAQKNNYRCILRR